VVPPDTPHSSRQSVLQLSLANLTTLTLSLVSGDELTSIVHWAQANKKSGKDRKYYFRIKGEKKNSLHPLK